MSVDQTTQNPQPRWSTIQAYQMGAVALALGLVLGFFVRGLVAAPRSSQSRSPVVRAGTPAAAHSLPAARPGLPEQNLPEVGARAAREVLEKLKTDPNNFDLLVQVGNIYLYSRVFAGAAGYYQKALQIKDDLKVRNEYASALFYSGDPDAALQQYETILKADPRNDQALFNRGMVRWRGKQDAKGAIESWKLLLKLNPKNSRRASVEAMIARVTKDERRVP